MKQNRGGSAPAPGRGNVERPGGSLPARRAEVELAGRDAGAPGRWFMGMVKSYGFRTVRVPRSAAVSLKAIPVKPASVR
jgi:hypothetical protein